MTEVLTATHIQEQTNIPDISNKTLGLIIVGQAQVGKTTVRSMVGEAWRALDPDSNVHEYSASNGFRGLAASVLGRYRFDFNEPIDAGHFTELMEAYAARFNDRESFGSHLDGLFREPLPQDILRNPAVTAATPIVNRSRTIRDEIVGAAGRHLQNIVRSKNNAPGLVVVDARSVHEHYPNIIGAGIRFAGTLLVTCDEAVAATRILPSTAGPEEIAAEADRLRTRNSEDAKESGADMTTPAKLDVVHDLYDITQSAYPDTHMRFAAAHGLDNPRSAMHIRAERFTLADEATAITLAIRGIKQAAHAQPIR